MVAGFSRLAAAWALLVAQQCYADLPVHCLHSEIVGEWVFFIGPDGQNSALNCSKEFPIVNKTRMWIVHPNKVALPEMRNEKITYKKGTWTTVYDEGFEVRVQGKRYFAFSKYLKNESSPIGYTSLCNETFPGYYHDELAESWGCYIAWKQPKPIKCAKATVKGGTSKVVDACNISTAWAAPVTAGSVSFTGSATIARIPDYDMPFDVSKVKQFTPGLRGQPISTGAKKASKKSNSVERMPEIKNPSQNPRPHEKPKFDGGDPNTAKEVPSVSSLLKTTSTPKASFLELGEEGAGFQPNRQLVEAINDAPEVGWSASSYLELGAMTNSEVSAMLGTVAKEGSAPYTFKDLRPDEEKYAGLPEAVDWRSKDGINYVTSARDQDMKSIGKVCGSCYAVAVLGMVEARTRIATKMKWSQKLSVQDVVSCSMYSQGCDGGFPYLVGKYGYDFGYAPESCMPYNLTKYYKHKPSIDKFMRRELPCPANEHCPMPLRRRARSYKYVGGYYGNCSEVAMMKEIAEKGPLAVGLYAENDLLYYKTGIYSSTKDYWLKMKGRTAPVYNEDKCLSGCVEPKRLEWQKTNHALLIVGYGVEPENKTKYWIAQNSWGSSWGEDGGYVRMKRGEDESSIESMAVAVEPMV